MKPPAITDVDIAEMIGNNPTCRTRREPKACRCGYIRTVTVHFIEQHGTERDHRWERLCAACRAEERARYYASEAARFRRITAELREKQAKSAQRRILGKRR